MDLHHPQDFRLLEALHSYGRNVAPNLAHIADLDESMAERRLAALADHELVTRIGPIAESGLFEITDRGRIALRLRDEYNEGVDFGALVDRHLAVDDTGAATAIIRGKRRTNEDADS